MFQNELEDAHTKSLIDPIFAAQFRKHILFSERQVIKLVKKLTFLGAHKETGDERLQDEQSGFHQKA